MGLENAQVGDAVGDTAKLHFGFAPPTLEAAVVCQNIDQQSALHNALKQLAEQDPLINLRQTDQKLYVSLYGEVQKEVIATTLARDFGVEATFERTQPICIERLAGTGYAVQFLQEEIIPLRQRWACVLSQDNLAQVYCLGSATYHPVFYRSISIKILAILPNTCVDTLSKLCNVVCKGRR